MLVFTKTFRAIQMWTGQLMMMCQPHIGDREMQSQSQIPTGHYLVGLLEASAMDKLVSTKENFHKFWSPKLKEKKIKHAGYPHRSEL